jgi:predicted nucleotidyltransferase
VGIGSAFVRDRRFTWRSDIDIAVAGLPAERFFGVSAEAAELTDFALDIIPIESATDAMRRTLLEDGVDL